MPTLDMGLRNSLRGSMGSSCEWANRTERNTSTPRKSKGMPRTCIGVPGVRVFVFFMSGPC
jgi:hypothetical protein